MKISAFMPITNPEKRGDTYIEAIITHLYWADELVIVDGGSNDGSLEKIKALNDPRIRIVTRIWPQEDWSWAEFPKAWNYGLAHCTGDVVAAGESDHIFHENEAVRMKEELWDRYKKGKAVMTVNKMQALHYENWYSKSKMYYFINKNVFRDVMYGLDPKYPTDLCQPIIADGGEYDGIPTGKAILDSDTTTENMVGHLGPTLYNYLWTFKTYEMVIKERLASMNAWNKYKGFTEIHKKRFPQDEESVRKMITQQLEKIVNKTTHFISLDKQPKIMQESIKARLVDGMLGTGKW